MENILKRRGLASKGSSKVLTAAMFLGKGYTPAYATSSELIQFVDETRIEDVQEQDALFSLTKEGLKIILPRVTRQDKGGCDYKYATFIRPNSPEGVKVVLFGNINQFLVDYRDGKIKPNFTLEELLAEAEKA
jgi:hypothetical protein